MLKNNWLGEKFEKCVLGNQSEPLDTRKIRLRRLSINVLLEFFSDNLCKVVDLSHLGDRLIVIPF